MRKVFWSCAAAAVVAAGSVYLAAKHIDQDPFAAMLSMATSACGGTGSGTCPAGPSDLAVPEAPKEVGMEALGGVIDPPPLSVVATSETTLPGEINVSEGGITLTGGSQDRAEDTGLKPDEPPATIDGAMLSRCLATSAPCPAVMPYCPEDGAAACSRMPYADEADAGCEEAEAKDGDKPESFFSFWMGVFGQSVREGLKPAHADSEGSESAPSDPPEAEGNAAGKCEEDHNYHQHCPSCPYTGRCYPETIPSPAVPAVEELEKQVPEEKTDGEEAYPKMAPIPEKKTNGAQAGDMPPSNCDLDTMEFRASDLAGWESFLPEPL